MCFLNYTVRSHLFESSLSDPPKIYGWEVLCFAFKWHCFSFLISEHPLLLLLIPMYSDEWLPIDHVKLAPNILPALYSNWRKLLLIVDHITIALNIFGFLSQLPQAKLLALMWWISTPRSGHVHCSSVWGIIGLSQGPRSKLSYERLRQVPERIKFLLANWKLELLMFSSSRVHCHAFNNTLGTLQVLQTGNTSSFLGVKLYTHALSVFKSD